MIKLFKQNKRFLTLLLLIIILIISSYLRLYRISDYMTFLGDEGRDVLVVKRMIVDHKFTLLGPTASVGGFFLGPIYYYMMLPFLWLFKMDPAGPATMVALMGVMTVYLIYKLGKDFLNIRVGFIAASVYAVSPLVIAYSRSSWNPNVVPFFSTLLIYLLLRITIHEKPKEMLIAGIVLGIGIQLHYLFLFLFPLVFIWLLVAQKIKKYFSYYYLLILGFIIGYLPFLIFELRHGFPNTLTIYRFIIEGKDTGFNIFIFLSNINDVTFRLFGRLVLKFPQKEIWNNLPKWQLFTWITAVKTFIFTAFGLMIVVLAAKSRFGEKRLKFMSNLKNKNTISYSQTIALLSLWYVSVILLFGLYKRGIYDYYFGIFFTLPFILFGLILDKLYRMKWGKVPAVFILSVILYLNWQGRPFVFPPNRQLQQAKNISKAAFEIAGGMPYNFALITGQNSDHAYRYFFEIWGNPPITIENEANDPLRKTVQDQLIVICETYECKPLGHPLWEIAGFGRAQIVNELSVPFVKIIKLVHFKG